MIITKLLYLIHLFIFNFILIEFPMLGFVLSDIQFQMIFMYLTFTFHSVLHSLYKVIIPIFYYSQITPQYLPNTFLFINKVHSIDVIHLNYKATIPLCDISLIIIIINFNYFIILKFKLS